MLATHIQIDICFMIMIFIIYLNVRKSNNYSFDNKILSFLMVLVIFVLLFDALGWFFDKRVWDYSEIVLYFVDIIYFSLSCIIAFFWMIFVYIKLYGNMDMGKLKWAFLAVPLTLFLILNVTTPFTKLIFYVEGYTYVRGSMFALQTIINFGYLIASSIIAMIQREKEMYQSKKDECLYLALFPILPIIGGVLQIFEYDLNVLWPAASLSLLLIYINMSNEQISLDALTGLNNRGRFVKYINSAARNLKGGKRLYLFMMDIDDFKNINDTYGHNTGDEALIKTSEILKKFFSLKHSFISRYGGDEFAVVISLNDDTQADRVIKEMDKFVESYNENITSGYNLSLSIGYSYTQGEDFDLEKLIAEADENMYKEKRIHKRI